MEEDQKCKAVKTLGSVQLHNQHTGEIILIPQPSDDPNDPLNWRRSYRYYLAFVTCFALFMGNFLSGAPSVTLVEVAAEFFGTPPPSPDNPASMTPENITAFSNAASKTAYLFSASALAFGVSNLFWMPLTVKYGRRPIYVFSFALCTACAIWASRAQSWESALVARIIMAWASGTAECVGPLTISDIFFLHERGKMMALYSVALQLGTAGGSVLAGLISIQQPWRVTYYVGVALTGLVTLLIAFTMPETAFKRDSTEPGSTESIEGSSDQRTREKQEEPASYRIEEARRASPAKKSYWEEMRMFHGVLTEEPLWKIFTRPVAMLVLPPVLWATLVIGMLVGYVVAMSTVIPTAFQSVYGFKTWQIGVLWISNLIGAIMGIPFAGKFSDFVASKLTARNGGIREPEMRLPALIPAAILMPGSLILFGFGIEHRLHWIAPIFGLGMLGFTIVMAGNISTVYTIDAYRPIAGEVIVTQMAFKAIIAFLVAFYANEWVNLSGYDGAFGTMAGMSVGGMALAIPMYYWGKPLRQKTLGWPFMRMVDWSEDREVGE